MIFNGKPLSLPMAENRLNYGKIIYIWAVLKARHCSTKKKRKNGKENSTYFGFIRKHIELWQN